MLGKSITYRLLLRVADILLLLWALYIAFQIAIGPSYVGDTYVGLVIQYQFTEAIWLIFYEGAGFLAAAAVLLLGFSSWYPRVAYWSIQAALWFVGISLWYRFSQALDPWLYDPLWLIVIGICSALLFALYKPVMSLIRKLVQPKRKKPTIRPKNEPTSSSLYEQPQVMYPKQD